MATSTYQQYDHLEPTLQRINREYIRLNQEEVRRNNVVLEEVLKVILRAMKQNDIFRNLFRTQYYGGSYYDGLKVSKPDDYDLDLILDLPACARPVISNTEMPGYVRVKLENTVGYHDLAQKLLDENNYLSSAKVLSWMESVLTKAINIFDKLSERYNHVKELQGCRDIYYLAVVKQGPAFTLKINVKFDDKVTNMDINLVPSFAFKTSELPEEPYRSNDYYTLSDEFFIVPKRPKTIRQDHSSYWRLSFQEQESKLIENKERLKPAMRLIKKLRDSYNQKSIISTYYIKTIFLFEVLSADSNFWKHRSLSYVFMTMLKKYQSHLEDGDIPYFWNKNKNLLCHLHYQTSINTSCTINSVIRQLELEQDSENIPHYFAHSWEKSAFWNKITHLPPERRLIA